MPSSLIQVFLGRIIMDTKKQLHKYARLLVSYRQNEIFLNDPNFQKVRFFWHVLPDWISDGVTLLIFALDITENRSFVDALRMRLKKLVNKLTIVYKFDLYYKLKRYILDCWKILLPGLLFSLFRWLCYPTDFGLDFCHRNQNLTGWSPTREKRQKWLNMQLISLIFKYKQ